MIKRKYILISILIFIFSAQVEGDDPDFSEDQQKMTSECLDQTKQACYNYKDDAKNPDCEKCIDILNSCYNSCLDLNDMYEVTQCTLKNYFTCKVDDQTAAVQTKYQEGFINYQNCLINQRITLQIKYDEYYLATVSGTDQQKDQNKKTNQKSQDNLDQNVYSQIQKELITDFENYFSKFKDTFNAYQPNADSDTSTLGQNRVNYYQSELNSMLCYEKDASLCANYKDDLSNCEQSVYALHSCMDKYCQFYTGSTQKYVCQIEHFEECEADSRVYNQIVKINLSCIYSAILFTINSLLYLLFLI